MPGNRHFAWMFRSLTSCLSTNPFEGPAAAFEPLSGPSTVRRSALSQHHVGLARFPYGFVTKPGLPASWLPAFAGKKVRGREKTGGRSYTTESTGNGTNSIGVVRNHGYSVGDPRCFASLEGG